MSKLWTFSVRINERPVQSITTLTSSYRLAAAAAVATLGGDVGEDGPLDSAVVEIWVDAHQPDYPPTFYEVGENEYGHLVVPHLPGCERRPDGSLIWHAYQGHGAFKWYERRDGEWHPFDP